LRTLEALRWMREWPGSTASAVDNAGAASSGGGRKKMKGAEIMSKKIGIVERAKQAKSLGELKHLQVEIDGYSFVSAQTLGRFRRAVIKRQKELRSED
jgi:hypothetical protein